MSDDRTRQRLTAVIENALEEIELAPVLMEDDRDFEKILKIQDMADKLRVACLEWQAYMSKEPVQL